MAKKKKNTSNVAEVHNAAKTLFANIQFMSPDSPIRSLVVTSAIPNEGKTTTSIELGRAIATSGKRVLMVEADMRHRSVAAMLSVHPPVGLYAVLTEAASLSDAITTTSVRNLFLLDVEPRIPNPADVLSSVRYRDLVKHLAESYDYVIYDTPPVATFVDAAILSTYVDGTILVVKQGGPKKAELVDAYEQLQKAGANVIGVCATFSENLGADYYYAYYTGSGERVASDKNLVTPPVVPPAHSSDRRPTPQGGAGRAPVRQQGSGMRYPDQAYRAGRVGNNPEGKGQR